MCLTVIIAPMVIQKEQCAAEYHWQLWVPTITAKNALNSIEVFILFSNWNYCAVFKAFFKVLLVLYMGTGNKLKGKI